MRRSCAHCDKSPVAYTLYLSNAREVEKYHVTSELSFGNVAHRPRLR
jgi:hypothetical protein